MKLSNWRRAKTLDVIAFIKHHIVYRFCVPRSIAHHNESQFINQAIYDKFWIQSITSMVYNLPGNDLAKALDKTITKLL